MNNFVIQFSKKNKVNINFISINTYNKSSMKDKILSHYYFSIC